MKLLAIVLLSLTALLPSLPDPSSVPPPASVAASHTGDSVVPSPISVPLPILVAELEEGEGCWYVEGSKVCGPWSQHPVAV